MTSIKKYDLAFREIVEEFVETYFTYSDWHCSNYYIIWEGSRLAPNVVEISDYFWNIDQMYEAISNKVSKDALFEWYDYALDKAQLKQPAMNLPAYYLWEKKYTDKEKKEAQKNIKKSYKILLNEIKKCKKKTD